MKADAELEEGVAVDAEDMVTPGPVEADVPGVGDGDRERGGM